MPLLRGLQLPARGAVWSFGHFLRRRTYSRWAVIHGITNPNGIPSQSPGLRGTSYPGVIGPRQSTPTGLRPSARCYQASQGVSIRSGVAQRRPPTSLAERVVLARAVRDATPLGLVRKPTSTQGSRFAPTLGFEAKSLWDF